MRRAWAASLGGLAVAVLLVLGAAPASAHAVLLGTTPATGSEVGAAPSEVVLRFGESVGMNRRSVEVLDSAGHRVDLGSVVHPGGDATRVRVRLRSGLAKGAYLVVWRVVSADSHPVAGSFSFGFGVPATSSPSGPDLSTDPLLGSLHALARWTAFAATTVLVGGAFFVVLFWREGWASRRVRRIVGTAWVAAVVSTVLLLVLEGPYGASLGLSDVTDPALLGVTLGTLYGKLLLLRLGALLLALAVWWPVRSGREVPGRFDVAGLTLLVIESFSFAGHAGQGDLVPLAATADAVHLLAASVWIGGLVVLAAAWTPAATARWSAQTATTLRRWSRTAAAAVAVLVVTGTFQAWRTVAGWPALWSTTYGLLVLGKVAVLLAVLAFAAGSRSRAGRLVAAAEEPAVELVGAGGPARVAVPQVAVRPETDPEIASPVPPVVAPTLARLRRSVVLEAVLLAGVLGLTAVLVDTVPAVQAYSPSFSATVPGVDTEGDTIRVHVTFAPTRAGSQTVDIEAQDAAGAPLSLGEVDGSLTAPALGLGPLTFTARPAGTGRAQASGVAVPAPGSWTVDLQLRTGPVTDYAATLTYQVS